MIISFKQYKKNMLQSIIDYKQLIIDNQQKLDSNITEENKNSLKIEAYKSNISYYKSNILYLQYLLSDYRLLKENYFYNMHENIQLILENY